MEQDSLKHTMAVLLGLSLSACNGNSDTARTAQLIYDYVRGTPQQITRDQAAAVPYATMGMALGGGPQGLLVLGSITAEQADWFAGERVFVATRRGQIVRTLGLPYDLGALHIEPAAGETPARAGTILPQDRVAFDFPDLGIFGAIAQCSAKDAGADTVEILGAALPTRHIVQHCDVPVLSWRFDNDFWEDLGTGQIWRSSQHIHPKSPPVTLVVLRPVEGDGAG